MSDWVRANAERLKLGLCIIKNRHSLRKEPRVRSWAFSRLSAMILPTWPGARIIYSVLWLLFLPFVFSTIIGCLPPRSSKNPTAFATPSFSYGGCRHLEDATESRMEGYSFRIRSSLTLMMSKRSRQGSQLRLSGHDVHPFLAIPYALLLRRQDVVIRAQALESAA